MDSQLTVKQFHTLAKALPDPVFILTESGRYADILGGESTSHYHNGSSLIGQSLFDVIGQQKANWFLSKIHDALESQELHTVEYGLSANEVYTLESAEGPEGVIWFEGRIQAMQGTYQRERAVVWVARNITERYELESKLRYLSETDELTGALNRRKLLTELEHRFKEHKRYLTPICFIIIDFDHFKNINDKFGHLIGDKVIRTVIQLCQQELRETDQLARLGGEEFAILLPNTEVCEAKPLAERLREAVASHPYDFLPERWPVTISLGISQIKSEDRCKEELIARADRALYQAKDSGRNCVQLFMMS